MAIKKTRKLRTDNPRFNDILDVAARIFRQKGYHHANISDIAEGAGLLKGSLYYYIKSKEELLYNVVMRALDLYIVSLGAVFDSTESPDIILREAIVAHMSPIDIQFDMTYVFLIETNNLTDTYKKRVVSETVIYEKLWIKLIREGKRQGVFSAGLDSKITVFSIFGICNATLRWYRPGGKYSIKDLAEIFSHTILCGIGTDAERCTSTNAI